MAMHVDALPASDMASLRAELPPRYGARKVDEGDRCILFIRVPRKQPDPVNDVESAVDFLDEEDVDGITHCILVGDEQVAQVYAAPLRDLMARRLQFDAAQFEEWRGRLPDVLAHQLYRSPQDPRRRWRLAVRVPCETISDMTESMLEELADAMGSQLESQRFSELAAVYLLAGKDQVRMEPDVFVQEMRKTWQDEERKQRLIREREAAKEAERVRQAAERRNLMRELGGRYASKSNPVPAPPKAPPLADDVLARATDTFEGNDTQPLAQASSEVTTAGESQDALHARVDRLTRHAPPAATRVETVTPAADKEEPARFYGDLAGKLRSCGFEVLEKPETSLPIDLAAERPTGNPQRVVARFMERVKSSDAADLLRIGRELDVDGVLVVTDMVEPEAERQLVASKVTCLSARDVDALRL